jgi:hypothetical protein
MQKMEPLRTKNTTSKRSVKTTVYSDNPHRSPVRLDRTERLVFAARKLVRNLDRMIENEMVDAAPGGLEDTRMALLAFPGEGAPK